MSTKGPMRPSRAALELRERANERLQENPDDKPAAPGASDNPQRLLHELQVYQVELELQNEQLEAARSWVEAALASYTDLYDFAPVAYFTFDRAGAISETNLAGAKLLGIERARLLDKRFGVFVQDSERGAFNAFLKRAFAEQAEAGFELTLVAKDGSRRIVQIDTALTGKGESCHAVMVDVSARVQRERKSALLAQVFSSASEAMFITDAANLIVEVNAAFCAVTGYSEAQALGQPAGMLRAQHQPPGSEQARLRELAANGGWSGDSWHLHPNGDAYRVAEQVSALRDGDGTVQHYVSRFRRAEAHH